MSIFLTLWKFLRSIIGLGTVTSTTTTKQSDPKKKAICIGINQYPNPQNNLRGCVNDARTWASLLKDVYGFTKPTLLLNNAASYGSVTLAFKNMIKASQPGDVLVLTVSSHGTSVPDNDGDEDDKRDEAICLYDRLWLDDRIRKVLTNYLDPEATMVFISDSCHSGTVTRSFIRGIKANCEGDQKIGAPRYLPPRMNRKAESLGTLKIGKRIFYPEDDMKEILLSGCKSNEYSYDAYFGKPMGAMTHFATTTLRDNPNVTYKEFYASLRKSLPSSRYPQTPQLEGKKTNLNKPVFS